MIVFFLLLWCALLFAHYSRTHTCKHSRVIHKHTSIISVEFFRSSSIIPNDFPYFMRVLSFTVYYFLYTLNFHMFRFFVCKSIFTNFFQQKCICHLVFFSATHPFLFEMCFLFLSLATLFSYLFFSLFFSLLLYELILIFVLSPTNFFSFNCIRKIFFFVILLLFLWSRSNNKELFLPFRSSLLRVLK